MPPYTTAPNARTPPIIRATGKPFTNTPGKVLVVAAVVMPGIEGEIVTASAGKVTQDAATNQIITADPFFIIIALCK